MSRGPRPNIFDFAPMSKSRERKEMYARTHRTRERLSLHIRLMDVGAHIACKGKAKMRDQTDALGVQKAVLLMSLALA
jgi:hypothetical protein